MTDQPPPRRRFQFRLRTLMIGVTLVAVACAVTFGIVLPKLRELRDRQRAEEIKQKMDAVSKALDNYEKNPPPRLRGIPPGLLDGEKK